MNSIDIQAYWDYNYYADDYRYFIVFRLDSANKYERMINMYNIKKSAFSVVMLLVLLLSMALPMFAAGPMVIENTDYITEDTVLIGAKDFPLYVRGDGSFFVPDDLSVKEVIFGVRTPNATAEFKSLPYPISAHTYKSGGLEFDLHQFVLESDEGNMVLYARLKVKNTTDVSVSFPKVEGAAARRGVASSTTVRVMVVVRDGVGDGMWMAI